MNSEINVRAQHSGLSYRVTCLDVTFKTGMSQRGPLLCGSGWNRAVSPLSGCPSLPGSKTQDVSGRRTDRHRLSCRLWGPRNALRPGGLPAETRTTPIPALPSLPCPWGGSGPTFQHREGPCGSSALSLPSDEARSGPENRCHPLPNGVPARQP